MKQFYDKKENNVAKPSDINEVKSKNTVIEWLKSHWIDIMVTGIGIAAIASSVMYLKNNEETRAFLEDLKKKIGNELLSKPRKIADLTIEELNQAREEMNMCFQKTGDVAYEAIRNSIDKEINLRGWDGQTPRGPTYSREHAGIYKPD